MVMLTPLLVHTLWRAKQKILRGWLALAADFTLQRLASLAAVSLEAPATLLVEAKFARGGSAAGHIVSRSTATDVDRTTFEKLLSAARKFGCYKVIINTAPAQVPMLISCGFIRKELTMVAVRQTSQIVDESGQRVLPRSPQALEVAGYTIRPLASSEDAAAYIHLLNQLSNAPPLSRAAFERQLNCVFAARGKHNIYVVESGVQQQTPEAVDGNDRVGDHAFLACASLVIQDDFWGNGGDSSAIALIEDVVCDTRSRGTGLGRALIRKLLEMSWESGCTRTILNCSVANLHFYRKCGFSVSSDACYSCYL